MTVRERQASVRARRKKRGIKLIIAYALQSIIFLLLALMIVLIGKNAEQKRSANHASVCTPCSRNEIDSLFGTLLMHGEGFWKPNPSAIDKLLYSIPFLNEKRLGSTISASQPSISKTLGQLPMGFQVKT